MERLLQVASVGAILSVFCSLAACHQPIVLSEYRSKHGARGRLYPRHGPHPGVDFRVRFRGDAAIAAAAGVVMWTEWDHDTGFMVLIAHRRRLSTVYAHLGRLRVHVGDVVARGEPIGDVNVFPNSGGIAHVHLQLCTSWSCLHRTEKDPYVGTIDPLPYSVGCFDPAARYPTTRLVLTYPVVCAPGSE
jgi:murein DD-endopeptidase MepM/ murein hydrolase activator NlpD